MMYSGSEWVKNSLKKKMSPLGEKTADLLGVWARGIYHIESSLLSKVDWTAKYTIEIKLSGSFSTFDMDELTRLVLLAHWYAIRVEINPCNPNHFRVYFCQRKRDGRIMEGHPTIDEAVTSFKASMQTYGIEEFGEKEAQK